MEWHRVTHKVKCPICQKPDWCCISESLVLCMRIVSDRPSRNGGWLHKIGDEAPIRKDFLKPEAPRPTINATAIWRGWCEQTPLDAVERFARALGVESWALHSLGIAWAPPHRAWAFPMKDGYGNVVGLRLRSEKGEKWAVTGSHAGLFYGNVHQGEAAVCEGPTDTAAGLCLGLNVVGRPSCQGQEEELCTCLRHARRVLIIADNDGPGWTGAQRLQQRLKVPSLIWAPPCKDLREFYKSGGDRKTLDFLTGAFVWTVP